jgi:hypothetical protein
MSLTEWNNWVSRPEFEQYYRPLNNLERQLLKYAWYDPGLDPPVRS